MYDNLDENGRVGGISAKPEKRPDFDKALSFGPDALGVSRSEFVVMACVMLALDLGMDEQEKASKNERNAYRDH